MENEAVLLIENSWSHNLAVFSRCKTIEKRKFYLNLCKKENYSFKELDRQIPSSLFERTMVGNKKLSTVLREIHPKAEYSFKDNYIFDFLNLPESFNENDLKSGLLLRMKDLILELGKDFLFIDLLFLS